MLLIAFFFIACWHAIQKVLELFDQTSYSYDIKLCTQVEINKRVCNMKSYIFTNKNELNFFYTFDYNNYEYIVEKRCGPGKKRWLRLNTSLLSVPIQLLVFLLSG